MDLLVPDTERNQLNDIPLWFSIPGMVMVSCFFFFFSEPVCWGNQSISFVLSCPSGKALWSSKVFLDMTDWPHPHSFHLTYMGKGTEWWEVTQLLNNISIKRQKHAVWRCDPGVIFSAFFWGFMCHHIREDLFKVSDLYHPLISSGVSGIKRYWATWKACCIVVMLMYNLYHIHPHREWCKIFYCKYELVLSWIVALKLYFDEHTILKNLK